MAERLLFGEEPGGDTYLAHAETCTICRMAWNTALRALHELPRFRARLKRSAPGVFARSLPSTLIEPLTEEQAEEMLDVELPPEVAVRAEEITRRVVARAKRLRGRGKARRH